MILAELMLRSVTPREYSVLRGKDMLKGQQAAQGWHSPYPFLVYSAWEAPSCVSQVKNGNNSFITNQVMSLPVLTDQLANSSHR